MNGIRALVPSSRFLLSFAAAERNAGESVRFPSGPFESIRNLNSPPGHQRPLRQLICQIGVRPH